MIETLNNYIFYFITIFLYNSYIFINFSKISKIYNLFDYPDNKRKIHNLPVSLFGGFLILSNFLFLVFFLFLIDQLKSLELYLYIYSYKNLIIFLLVLLSIFLLGVLDDKYSINPIKKLVILILLISILCINNSDTLVSYFLIPFENTKIIFSQLSLFFSILCYVFLIISLNMFDGINLQSFFFFFINFIFLQTNLPIINPVILILLLSLIIFGYLNYKNKTFLGDNGSYILSLILGYFYVKTHNNEEIYNSIDIVNFLFLPIIDSLRVIFIRQIKSKAFFLPDKIHIHHYLLQKVSHNKTLIILSFLILLPHILFYINLNSVITLFIQIILYFSILHKL